MRDQDLESNIIPAVKGEVVRLTIDTTARAYDIRNLKLGRAAAPTDEELNPDHVFVRLTAENATVYYQFSDDGSATLDTTAAVAAGGTLAEANTYGEPIAAGAWVDFKLVRSLHQYLHVQGSAAGYLTIRHSSYPSR